MKELLEKYIQEIEQYKYQGKYDLAKKKVSDCLLNHADDYRLYEELADISLYEGKVDDAETAMKHAQKLHADSATGTYLLGYIHISK